MDVYDKLARPLLWRMDAERAHDVILGGLAAISRSRSACEAVARFYSVDDERLKVEAFGLTFTNPLMVAAGLDKKAEAVPALIALGFGGVEVGTITPRFQPGNPRPRIFRLPEDHALINRMGFPGPGAEIARINLDRFKDVPGIVGLNIGPNKQSVELGQANGDYLVLLHGLGQFGAYIAINVSSPNTEGLRALQEKQQLSDLLREVVKYRDDYMAGKPILLKIAPDVTEHQLLDIIQVVSDVGLDGIIATNTLAARPVRLQSPNQHEKGGLSGKPLRKRSLEVVQRIYRETNGQLPIVAAGGIFSGDHAWNFIAMGASVVQVYTGFVYGGPSMPHRTLRRLLDLLDGKRYDFSSISEVRGSAAHLY